MYPKKVAQLIKADTQNIAPSNYKNLTQLNYQLYVNKRECGFTSYFYVTSHSTFGKAIFINQDLSVVKITAA